MVGIQRRIHNKKLGYAPRTYNCAISVRKTNHDILQNFPPFLSLLLMQKIKIWMLSFYK